MRNERNYEKNKLIIVLFKIPLDPNQSQKLHLNIYI